MLSNVVKSSSAASIFLKSAYRPLISTHPWKVQLIHHRRLYLTGLPADKWIESTLEIHS